MAEAESLLVEILVEELPPGLAGSVAGQVGLSLARQLEAKGFLSAGGRRRALRTPRRLAFLYGEVRGASPVSSKLMVGPAADVALDDEGRPAKALEGFARSCGVDVAALERREHKGRERFCATVEMPSVPLEDALPQMVEEALQGASVPRLMRWDGSKRRFVRPVRGIVMMHGPRTIAGEVMGVPGGNSTRGHRLLAPQEIGIGSADAYEQVLREQGHVVADYDDRRNLVLARLREIGKDEGIFFLPGEGGAPAAPELERNEKELVPEGVEMVEEPHVLAGKIDPRYLSLPKELLAACLQGQQGYFMALDAGGATAPAFALLSNAPGNPGIVRGNERVLEARFADAEFFVARDRETPRRQLKEKLGKTTFHRKLGSQAERAKRMAKVAGDLAAHLGADAEAASDAASASLDDLPTATVGEFPELQGLLLRELLPEEDREKVGPKTWEILRVALARAYAPPQRRLAGDGKMAPEACCVALAFHAERLVSLMAAGESSSGALDPFGLRRDALGMAMIAIRERFAFSLGRLIGLAQEACGEIARRDGLAEECAVFVRERARNVPGLFDVGGEHCGWLANAALGCDDDVLSRLPARALALAKFAAKPEAPKLAEANKRLGNIFRKSDEAESGGAPEAGLLALPEEKELLEVIARAQSELDPLLGEGNFDAALDLLGTLAEPLDRFFEKVLVNDPDPGLRRNRFLLLGRARALLAKVADFSAIEIGPGAG